VGCDGWGSRLTIYIANSPIIIDHHRSFDHLSFSNGKPCLYVAISFCRHRSVPVPCENGSAETTVAEGGRNPVAGLWGHTLGEN